MPDEDTPENLALARAADAMNSARRALQAPPAPSKQDSDTESAQKAESTTPQAQTNVTMRSPALGSGASAPAAGNSSEYGAGAQAGIDLAKQYLCAHNGDSDSAQFAAMTDRAKRKWEALTPEGKVLRDAEHYLTAYDNVVGGRSKWYGGLGGMAMNEVAIPVWQALRVVQNWRGYEKDSPASLNTMIAGATGGQDALSGVQCARGAPVKRKWG